MTLDAASSILTGFPSPSIQTPNTGFFVANKFQRTVQHAGD
jgi:hypothetical protein